LAAGFGDEFPALNPRLLMIDSQRLMVTTKGAPGCKLSNFNPRSGMVW